MSPSTSDPRSSPTRLGPSCMELEAEVERLTKERDEAREKLVGVNVLKCLLVDAEKARDEAQFSDNERRSGHLIFQSQIHAALDRAEPSNHNDGVLNRIVRIVDRALAAESRAERLGEALREIDAKAGHFHVFEPAELFPYGLIAEVARIARRALAPKEDKG